jgi:hypothetical protein
MSFDRTSDAGPRERIKQERREEKAKHRAALAADPRVQAMKKALKERQRAAYAKAKERRKAIAAEQKQQLRERKATDRAKRDAALMKLVHLATAHDDH